MRQTYISHLWRLLLVLTLTGLPLLPAPLRASPTDAPERLVSDTLNEWTLGGGQLYWAYRCYGGEFRGDAYLKRQPVYGGLQRLLSTADSAHCVTFLSMAADDTGLYYYDADEGRFEFRPSGSPEDPPTEVLATNRGPGIDDIAIDGDYLYWIDTYLSGSEVRGDILRTRKDGSGELQTVVSNLVNPGDVLARDGLVYFLDASGLSSINCASFPCTDRRLLASSNGGRDLHFEWGVFLAGSYVIYWVEQSSPQKIRRRWCRFIGGDFICSNTILYTAPSASWSIGQPVVQGDNLFFVERFSGGTPDGRIQRMPASGGTAQEIVINVADVDYRLFVDNTYLYFARTWSDTSGIYRLPLDAAAITRDLAADALEVTQAIQNLANGAPLVANRGTYVRAYARQLTGPGARNVEARLYGTRGGSPLPGSPLAPLNGARPLNTGAGYNRANLDDGWLFLLPSTWRSAGTITLRLVVDPQQIYSDSNRANNELSRTVTFTGKAPVCTVYVPVRTHSPPASTDNPNFWPMVHLAKRLWPTPGYWSYHQTEDIAETEVCWWGPFPHPCFGPYELPDDSWKVLNSLNVRDFFTDDPDACEDARAKTHYVGMVHPSTSTSGVLGAAYLNSDVAWVKFPPHTPTSSSRFDWPGAGVTLAHELGHNQGRRHVDCGEPENTDPHYPYSTDQIANTGADSYYGFDPKTRTPIEPDDAADYMSYCRPRWTSDYTWRAIFNTVRTVPASLSQADLSAAAAAVFVTGGVDPTAATGTLNYAWVYPTTAMSAAMLEKWQQATAGLQAADRGAEDIRLRLLGPDGAVLADQLVTLLESEDHATATKAFVLTFPAPEATVARVELVMDGTVLDSREPGTAFPTVSVQQPAGGGVISDTLTLRWQAVDPDPGDALLFNVQYSPDDGATWSSLLTDSPGSPESDTVSLTLSELTIPASLPNQARIRVAASDGYHTTLAQSAGFTVTNRRPQAFIAAPTEGDSFQPGRPILLQGAATDVEDGGLPDSALSWTLNGQSQGTGQEVVVDGLGPGNYQAVLRATDNDGATGTAQVNFQIQPLGIPLGSAPTLDGFCDDSAYAGGVQLRLAPYSGGTQAQVTLLRSSDYLWACFSNMARGSGSPIAFAGVRVDVNNSRDNLAQADDYGFFVGEDGGHYTYRGDGAGGFNSPGPGGLAAHVSADSATWHAELRIDAGVLGGWNHLVSLNLGHYWVRFQGDDYEWPYDTSYNRPNTWALTALGTLPVLTRLEPEVAEAGSGPLSLVVRGQHFQEGAVVRWGETDLSTQFGSSNVVTATVSATLLASPGTVEVTVHNPGGADLVSNALPFVVISPTPMITGLSPSTARAGGSDLTLTVDGQQFLEGATVLWDGTPLPTTYVSGTQLSATVASALMALGGEVGITVRNPGPDGPTSVPVQLVLLSDRLFLPLIAR